MGETNLAGERSSLRCPSCGSMNTKIIDFTLLVPMLKCSDCGREWMPSPEGVYGFGGTLASPSWTFETDVKNQQKPMGVFQTALLLLIMLAIILVVVVIINGIP